MRGENTQNSHYKLKKKQQPPQRTLAWKCFPPSVLPISLLTGETLILNLLEVAAVGCLAAKHCRGYCTTPSAPGVTSYCKFTHLWELLLVETKPLTVQRLLGTFYECKHHLWEQESIPISQIGTDLSNLPWGNLGIQYLTLVSAFTLWTVGLQCLAFGLNCLNPI